MQTSFHKSLLQFPPQGKLNKSELPKLVKNLCSPKKHLCGAELIGDTTQEGVFISGGLQQIFVVWMVKVFAENPEGPSLAQQACLKLQCQDAAVAHTPLLSTSCPLGPR